MPWMGGCGAPGCRAGPSARRLPVAVEPAVGRGVWTAACGLWPVACGLRPVGRGAAPRPSPRGLPVAVEPAARILVRVVHREALVIARAAGTHIVALPHEELANLQRPQAETQVCVLAQASRSLATVLVLRVIQFHRVVRDDLQRAVHHGPAVAPALAPAGHLVAVRDELQGWV